MEELWTNSLVHRNISEIFHIKRLKTRVAPYQIEVLQWLLHHRILSLGALLADDMGLGKPSNHHRVVVFEEKMKNSSTFRIRNFRAIHWTFQPNLAIVKMV